MLETYFGSPKMVAHLRAGPSGPHMDGFAGSLKLSGYEPSVAVRYLRAAAHIGHFTLEQGGTFGQHGFVGLRTPFANVPLSAAQRRGPQPPYGLRRPGVTTNTLSQSVSARAAVRQTVRRLIRRSSSNMGDGCGDIAARQKRPSDFIRRTPVHY
jgi:hypothetical protein